MKKENALIIVPSEKLLDAPVFERKLKKGERHIKYIKEFCDTYQNPNFVPEMNDNIAPIYLSQCGHLVIKTSHDAMNIAVFYIPEELTLNEQKWIDENIMKYYSYEYTGFNYFDGKKRITTSNFRLLTKEVYCDFQKTVFFLSYKNDILTNERRHSDLKMTLSLSFF